MIRDQSHAEAGWILPVSRVVGELGMKLTWTAVGVTLTDVDGTGGPGDVPDRDDMFEVG